MNNRFSVSHFCKPLARLIALVALCSVALAPATFAQQTAGGTQINNRATATYSDGTNDYETISNLVTVEVANVSGLAITPDGTSLPAVVAGETGVDFIFTVTNSSNFPTQVRFLQNGASVQLSGPATVQAAVIDADLNGLDGSDADILNNSGGDVLSAVVPRDGTIRVIVRVNVNAGAADNASISVQLGDADDASPFDNEAADNSANEVRTSVPTGTTAPPGGESEARGSITTTVQRDAQLTLSLNAPAGPAALGSNITYSFSLENTGLEPVAAQTLSDAPAGSNTGVYVIAPVPANTTFVSATAPVGVTILYSTSALGADPAPGDPPLTGPLSAATNWQSTPPAGTITRVAFRVGATLAVGATVSGLDMVVQINTGINASNPIYQIGDAFGRNSIASPITDQSGDVVGNKGDGNANFNEPRRGVAPDPDEAVSATQGYQLPTTLQEVGDVLIGPDGQPDATGPAGNLNTDYTNKVVAPAAIVGLGFGDDLTADTDVDFVNTVRNDGNADDVFTLTAPTVPAGFTVLISTNGGGSFVDVTSGGSTTVNVNFGQEADILVRVTAPTGTDVLNGFEVVVRATSVNTPASFNETIDRLYTGFLRLQKSVAVVGGGDAVPGAQIEYTITYTNISVGGGTNCVDLNVTSMTITEDGGDGTNNWGATTTHVVGSASDNRGGVITGDAAVNSTVLTDTVTTTLAPGDVGTFIFRRLIN
jgi:hypothetical protein